jgi:lipopolysaccharide/colanic/teichoic acid biosynthesis glycosyltransferase
LINVLFGQMTLVGPRPQTPALADRYPAELTTVFRYRPGLTGPGVLLLNDEDVLWGEPSDIDAYYLREVAPARVAVDLHYLEDPSLRRTLVLLFNTARRVPPRVFQRRTPLVPAADHVNGAAVLPVAPTFVGAVSEEIANLPLAATGRE